MISLYRFLPTEEHTLVVFQGHNEDIDAIRQLCGFRPYRTTLPTSYEDGFYIYIREPSRTMKENKVLDYLRQHYTPPKIEMLQFRGRHTLVNDRSKNQWAQYLEDQIRNFFSMKHARICKRGGLGSEIFRAQPIEPVEGIRVHDGISYRLYISPEWVAIIQIDIAYRFELNGSEAKRSDVYRHCAGNTNALEQLRQFELRSTDQIFDIAKRFVSSLEELGPEFQFNTEPSAAGEAGWEAWLWEHEFAPQLVGGNGSKLRISLDVRRSGVGIYKSPENVQLLILYPDDPSHETFPRINRRQFDIELRRIIRDLLPADSIEPLYFPYPLIGSFESTLEQIGRQNGGETQKSLILMIAPPEDSEKTNDENLLAADNQARQFNRELRRLKRNSYVVSFDWMSLLNENDRRFAINTSILKGLTVLGGIPWLIDSMPVTADYAAEDVCFIGVDVNPWRTPAVAGGVAIDGFGRLCGYHLVRLERPNGDRIGESELECLITRLRNHFLSSTGRNARHIILHRDGILNWQEAEHLRNLLQDVPVGFDLVEVRKSGAPRLRQPGNKLGTPSKDIAIGSERLARAFLCNTLSVGQPINKYNWIFPASEGLGIYRKDGHSPIKILAAQVYMLSLAHFANFHRTVRLPISTAYADALVNRAILTSGKTNTGKAIVDNVQPYWL